MAALSLIAKDIREHRLAALLLMGASLAVVLMLLAQNSAAAYSMSAFEIVRFSLLSFLPLTALIIGNRLIVREYLSGTRLFVEALPVGSVLPLVLKYLLGFAYLAVLSVAMVLMAAQQAGIADEVTTPYVLLMLGKTLVMASLYWSVVFCFSLCGYLRVALYLVSAALVMLIAYFPGINSDRFPPFALMDDQLFVFERDLIPWADIAGTGLISLVFTLAGFLLTRIGEGSFVERLAKPMTRRDFVALGVLAAAGLGLWTTLMDENKRDPIDFSSEFVIRLTDPAVSILYLTEDYEIPARTLADRLQRSLSSLQATLGLRALPTVQLALSPEREAHDFDYSTADGVFITANWLEHDSYDAAILDSVVMHGVLSAQTADRAMFEPYHWVLDGFTRWWVEQGIQTLDAQHEAELLARAQWVLNTDARSHQLVDRWQLTADRFSYPSAEALAWSAMSYIEQTAGRESVLALAHEFLVKPVRNNVLGTLSDRQSNAKSRIEAILGVSMATFYEQWQSWLAQQASGDAVITMLGSIPALKARVANQGDARGIHNLEVSYQLLPDTSGYASSIDTLKGQCVMKHDYIGAFDLEFEVSDKNEDVTQCQTASPAHTISSTYAPGDRVFIALDYEGDRFHQPIRLHAERLTVQ